MQIDEIKDYLDEIEKKVNENQKKEVNFLIFPQNLKTFYNPTMKKGQLRLINEFST